MDVHRKHSVSPAVITTCTVVSLGRNIWKGSPIKSRSCNLSCLIPYFKSHLFLGLSSLWFFIQVDNLDLYRSTLSQVPCHCISDAIQGRRMSRQHTSLDIYIYGCCFFLWVSVCSLSMSVTYPDSIFTKSHLFFALACFNYYPSKAGNTASLI